MATEQENDQLKAFLYLMMRDHLPCGIVAEVVREVVATADDEVEYSNGPLEEMADCYAARILGWKEPINRP